MISAAIFLGVLLAQPQPPAPAEGARTEQRNDRLHFIYSWPAQADALPGLRWHLQQRLAAARSEAQQLADTQRREEKSDGMAPPAHSHEQDWRINGRGGRLLSLSSLASFYRGGAHGSAVYEGILWDTSADAGIEMAELFQDARWADRFTARFCEALNRERRDKRDLPQATADELGPCPNLAEHVALPADTDGDQRFDTLSILLPPYAAGSYVEGTYEIDLPFTPMDVSRVRAEYRAAFEAGI